MNFQFVKLLHSKMKTICIYILVLFALPAFSQNKKYSSIYDEKIPKPVIIKKTLTEMMKLADKSPTDYNTYCWVKYHDEKMIGIIVELGSATLGGITSAVLWSSENSEIGVGKIYSNYLGSPAGIVSIIAGVGILAGIGIHLDAEKWINRKHLKFTGDKLTLNF